MYSLSLPLRHHVSLCRFLNLHKSLSRYALRNEINLENCSRLCTRITKIERLSGTTRGFVTCIPKFSEASAKNDSTTAPSFKDLKSQNILHPNLINTLTDDLSFDKMMPIQAATINYLIAERRDVMAQANTGTGKTVAFLLPAIQTLITRDRVAGSRISALVITPTRELTLQIATEANKLLKRFPQYKVGTAIGGIKKSVEEKRIVAGCDILVATPGRLLDYCRNSKEVLERFQSLDTLILDEADRLLDMGFMNDLKMIVSHLPDKKLCNTQGMLFSATLPPHVKQVANFVLDKDYKYISTVSTGERVTHEYVVQKLVTVPSFAEVAPALVTHLQAEIKENGSENFKCIIFTPTSAASDLYGHMFDQIPELSSMKFSTLNSRASQGKRNRVTSEFRGAKSAILVATDIVARGIDIPNISHIIQVGVPQDKQAYIHRLGRTARAGADGHGSFIISQPESFFVTKKLSEIKFQDCPADLSSQEKVLDIIRSMGSDSHKKAYQAWIGYYKTHVKDMGWTSSKLIEEAAVYAKNALGALEVPKLTKKVIANMGFRGMPGLVPEPGARDIRLKRKREELLKKNSENEALKVETV